LSKSHYTYTALFCEENIWLLAKSLQIEGKKLEQLKILFLSNTKKQIALFEQQSAPLGQAVIWDYHVLLLEQSAQGDSIYDFDSRLPFPCPAHQYFYSSFPEPQKLPQRLHFFIREIPAKNYLLQFYSDREHMKNQIPLEQFPPYPIIENSPESDRIVLQDYWDMQKEINDGSRVYAYHSVFQHLTQT